MSPSDAAAGHDRRVARGPQERPLPRVERHADLHLRPRGRVDHAQFVQQQPLLGGAKLLKRGEPGRVGGRATVRTVNQASHQADRRALAIRIHDLEADIAALTAKRAMRWRLVPDTQRAMR